MSQTDPLPDQKTEGMREVFEILVAMTVDVELDSLEADLDERGRDDALAELVTTRARIEAEIAHFGNEATR